MNKPMDCGEKKTTDWYDEARIAQAAQVSIKTVRRQWQRLWLQLDLPPLARGYLDAHRAEKLIYHLRVCRGRYRRIK